MTLTLSFTIQDLVGFRIREARIMWGILERPSSTRSMEPTRTILAYPFRLKVLFPPSLYIPFSSIWAGSSVKVFGSTNRVKNPTTGFDPSWECFVDKISIGATQPFEFAENNWLLCEQEQLVDGPHVVTVNVTQDTAAGRTFWFDNINYTPSLSVPKDGAYILIDNFDPDLFYGDGWGPLGGFANLTTTTSAELRFNFTGAV